MQTYSQLGQDLACLAHYNHVRGGYFVEIGASDGMELSNTYLLEKEYGWRGVCVEPIPDKFDALKQNRPGSVCVDRAVYHTSGETLDFFVCFTCSLLSGIPQHLNLQKQTVLASHTAIRVTTVTLLDLLRDAGAPRFIEYLSLDTEGSEYEILRGFDFSQYTFGRIDVEHNYCEPTRTNIRNLLEAHGYIFVAQNHWDDTYVCPKPPS
jgi:FkbM family methyltransferase